MRSKGRSNPITDSNIGLLRYLNTSVLFRVVAVVVCRKTIFDWSKGRYNPRADSNVLGYLNTSVLLPVAFTVVSVVVVVVCMQDDFYFISPSHTRPTSLA